MTNSVDVLEVMHDAADVLYDEGGDVTAYTLEQAQAAVAELIEAVEPFAVLADQLDAAPYVEEADDEEWAKFRMVVKDCKKLRAALRRVKGENLE